MPMTSHEMPNPCQCLFCGYQLDMASNVPGQTSQPKPGDVTMCFKCGGFMTFDDDLVMRKPTEEETATLMADPTVQKLVHSHYQFQKKGRTPSG